MRLPRPVPPDPNLDPRVKRMAEKYVNAALALSDRSFWGLRISVCLNVFLEHLEIFDSPQDPVPRFVGMFERAVSLLSAAKESGVGAGRFPNATNADLDEKQFEEKVSGLFSDVWVDMTDSIYFEESYLSTRERFERSGVDPEQFFRGKTVLDAGCGSGKFSASLARLGASKVIGVDIGRKGLEFARAQAQKISYGERLEFKEGSLLDIPLPNESVDIVWSNGVIHHTTGYVECIHEFRRVLKPGGTLYLYVNGRCGLFELILDTVRQSMEGIPRSLVQYTLQLLGMNSGRVYFVMDCLFAPYEWKSAEELKGLLSKAGFKDFVQLKRGISTDPIERLSNGEPFAEVKYGEGQLKFLATRT